MPSYGEKQKSAGVNKSPIQPKMGKRKMESANRMIRSGFSLTNCEYKGNAVFNANE